MSIKTLEDLFMHTLKDIYFAENHIVKSLPKMIKKAGDSELSGALEEHLEETKNQVERLKKVFALANQKPEGESCPAIEGIVKEAEELLGETDEARTRDAAIISAAQAVEHYEITRYGTLIAWAEELGYDEALELLEETLEEEKNADAKLTELGEGNLNRKAA